MVGMGEGWVVRGGVGGMGGIRSVGHRSNWKKVM